MLILYILFLLFILNLIKSNIENIILVAISMFIMSFFTLIYCYIILNISFQNSKINKRVENKLQNFNRDNNIFYSKNSEKYFLFLKDILQTIKVNQYNCFTNKGYIIIISGYNELPHSLRQKGTMGVFSRTQKYIIIYTDFYCVKENKVKSVNKESFKSTFYHEWGHFLDYANSNISYTRSFNKEFNKIKNRYQYAIRFSCAGIVGLFYRQYPDFNLNSLIDSSEYFATSYSEYKQGHLCELYFKNIFDKIENSCMEDL